MSSRATDSHLHLRRPTADGHHLLDQLLLLHLDGLLHGNLTEGVHGVLHAIGHHPGAVRLYTDLRGGARGVSEGSKQTGTLRDKQTARAKWGPREHVLYSHTCALFVSHSSPSHTPI